MNIPENSPGWRQHPCFLPLTPGNDTGTVGGQHEEQTVLTTPFKAVCAIWHWNVLYCCRRTYLLLYQQSFVSVCRKTKREHARTGLLPCLPPSPSLPPPLPPPSTVMRDIEYISPIEYIPSPPLHNRLQAGAAQKPSPALTKKTPEVQIALYEPSRVSGAQASTRPSARAVLVTKNMYTKPFSLLHPPVLYLTSLKRTFWGNLVFFHVIAVCFCCCSCGIRRGYQQHRAATHIQPAIINALKDKLYRQLEWVHIQPV